MKDEPLTKEEIAQLREILAEHTETVAKKTEKDSAAFKNRTVEQELKALAESYKSRLDSAPDKETRAGLIEEMTVKAKAIENRHK